MKILISVFLAVSISSVAMTKLDTRVSFIESSRYTSEQAQATEKAILRELDIIRKEIRGNQ